MVKGLLTCLALLPIAGCVLPTPDAVRNPYNPPARVVVMVTNPPPPVPPGLTQSVAPLVTSRIITVGSATVAVLPSRSNVLSLEITVPPNGANTTNRYWLHLDYSHDVIIWSNLTSFELLSGYKRTNNFDGRGASKTYYRLSGPYSAP